MSLFTTLVGIFLSIFSTAVMGYIAMATPIGPWIAPTLVIVALLIARLCRVSNESTPHAIALVTIAGSIGGIMATAFGFSFPTLYFLDAPLFMSWMASPIHFAVVLTALAFGASWFGMWVANIAEHKLLVQEQLAFPIGQLAYNMIIAQQQARKMVSLAVGFVGTMIFCFFQDGLFGFKGLLPKTILVSAPFNYVWWSIPRMQLDLWPMLWSIGFVTGHLIAIPLAIGALSKLFIIDPLNNALPYYMPSVFPHMTSVEFVLAFCSGMVLAGTISGFIKTPQVAWRALRRMMTDGIGANSNDETSAKRAWIMPAVELGFILIFLFSFFTYFKFSIFAQLYLLIFTFIFTNEIARQAGKIGLARLGMFATFVMVPAMLLFGLNSVQTVLVATFVEVCGGVAADVLFGRKIAQLSQLPHARAKRYQYLGLIVSSLAVGIIFWLFMHHFEIGSSELFAQKAKNRQLLIDIKQFNYVVLLIGACFGWILHKLKINPSLVLGGILMPLNMSIGLILGALFAVFKKDKQEFSPFWSGVFASNSLWMLIKTIL